MKRTLIFTLFFFTSNFLFSKSIDVAAFYYPHWHSYHTDKQSSNKDSSDWKLIKRTRPFFNGHRQPKRPYLNYPNSANPKHVEMEIDLASANGIDVFVYSWYWYLGRQTNQEALEQGFFNAPNNEKMKFAIMWINKDFPKTLNVSFGKDFKPRFKANHSYEDTLNAIDYCIKNYFSKSNYWRINGKIYLSIFDPNNFIEKIGGIQKTKELFETIDKKMLKANFPPIHWAANCTTKNDAFKFKKAGFSSIFSYKTPQKYYKNYEKKLKNKDFLFDYSDLMDASKKLWSDLYTSQLPNIPTVEQGSDTSPLCKQNVKFPFEFVKYPYLPIVIKNTSDKFETLLISAKKYIDTNSNTLPAIFINSWNNWSEGSAIFPECVEGMNFLRAVGRVFNPNSKTLTFASTYIKDKLCNLPQPDVRLNYAEYGKNAIDFWKAKNAKFPAPTIIYYHGGGWTNNCNLDSRLIKLFTLRDKGFNIAAVSYRFTHEVNHEIYPAVKAPMQDCANALAVIVENAKELGVDTSRISLTGGSAGACSSLWIALNAGKKLDSGRIIPQVKMISVVVPQTSLDPYQMREWIPNSNYGAHAFNLKNFNEFLQKRESILDVINQYSPYALLSANKNKTKFYLLNKYQPSVNKKVKDPTHASAFCIKFKEKCDKLNIFCEIIFDKRDWIASINNIEKNL